MLNPVALTGLIGKLAPVLKLLGIDPQKQVNKLGRDRVVPRFDAAVQAVVLRLEKDGLTPAAKATSPEGERVLIRAAMYLLAKEVFKGVLPKGANLAADFLRDQHDDQVVAEVGPQMDANTSTAEAVQKVKTAFVERVF